MERLMRCLSFLLIMIFFFIMNETAATCEYEIVESDFKNADFVALVEVGGVETQKLEDVYSVRSIATFKGPDFEKLIIPRTSVKSNATLSQNKIYLLAGKIVRGRPILQECDFRLLYEADPLPNKNTSLKDLYESLKMPKARPLEDNSFSFEKFWNKVTEKLSKIDVRSV